MANRSQSNGPTSVGLLVEVDYLRVKGMSFGESKSDLLQNAGLREAMPQWLFTSLLQRAIRETAIYQVVHFGGIRSAIVCFRQSGKGRSKEQD